MSTDPPTLGEVIRRLEALQATIERHHGEYVSRQELQLILDRVSDRVGTVNDKAVEALGGIEKIEEKEQAKENQDRLWRQQIMLVVLGFVLTNLVLIATKVTEVLT